MGTIGRVALSGILDDRLWRTRCPLVSWSGASDGDTES